MNYTSKEVEKLLTRLDDHEIDDDIAIPLDGMFREYILILKSIEESKSVQPHRLDVALREPNSIKSWQVASSPTHPPAESGGSKWKDPTGFSPWSIREEANNWTQRHTGKEMLLNYAACLDAMSAESREGKDHD